MKTSLWLMPLFFSLFWIFPGKDNTRATDNTPDNMPETGVISNELQEKENSDSDSNLERDPYLEPGFPVKAWHDAGTYMGGPAIHTLVGNIDADAELEIITTSLAQGPLNAWNSDGSRVRRWPVYFYNRAFYPALGNLSVQYPGMEIFTGQFISRSPETPPAPLLAYAGTGSLLPGWPRDSDFDIWGPAMLADIDGDNIDEIFIYEGTKLFAYNANGNPIPGWPVTGSDPSYAIADLNKDGNLEIVTYRDNDKGASLLLYNYDGSRVEDFSVFFKPYVHPFPVIGDVDGDKSLEIIIFSHTTNEPSLMIYIISADGKIEKKLPATIGNEYCYKETMAALALGDIDNDDLPEIVTGHASGLMAWNADGSPVPGFPVIWDLCYAHRSGNGAPVIGDVTGDGQPEIVLTAAKFIGGAEDGEVYVSDNRGNLLPGFPKKLKIGDGAVPAIADIDLDGRNEIIITGDYWHGYPEYFNKVWVYDLGGLSHGKIEWGQLQGGPQHQGIYPAPPEIYGVDLIIQSPEIMNASPGTRISIPLEYNNGGNRMASSVRLIATLDPNLTYVNDTSGIPPTIDGNQITWSLPNVFFYFKEGFSIEIQTPVNAKSGDNFSISFYIESIQTDENPDNNTTECQVQIIYETFIPVINRTPQE